MTKHVPKLVYDRLTARERALLGLRAALEDVTENENVRDTMPVSQFAEFSRLVSRLGGLQLAMSSMLPLLHARVDGLRVRLVLLQHRVALRDLCQETSPLLGPHEGMVPPELADGSLVGEIIAVESARFRDVWAESWQGLVVCEQVLKETVVLLDHGELLPPRLGALLPAIRDELNRLRASARPVVGPMRRPPRDERLLADLRELVGGSERRIV
ncbi:MAG: hypothetical protein R3C39_10530 [Dehalococcoidia bacterium]